MTRRYWLEWAAPDCDPLALLSLAGTEQGRYYFRSQGGKEVAGLGEAICLRAEGPSRLDSLSGLAKACFPTLVSVGESSGPGPIWLGGFAFDPNWSSESSSCWSGFDPACLILPEVSLVRRDGHCSLFAVAPPGMSQQEAEGVLAERLASVAALLQGRPGLEPLARSAQFSAVDLDGAEADRYEGQVRGALGAIAAGGLHKVIVARDERWQVDQEVKVVGVLAQLRARFPTCFVFSVQPPSSSAFVGASPERLVSCDRGELVADALAGTAGRGSTAVEDQSFGRGLLDSPKDRREHSVVVDYLREALGPLTSELRVGEEPALLRLANVQHLHTRLVGRLAEELDVLELAGRVHPTPAVGGLPREDALSWLLEREELDRGWYAGGVGLVEASGDGEFCVAIRSGLVEGSMVQLYAGAGIVEGSVPERERDEVDKKLRGLKEVFLHA